jgi:hypothetical protein
MTIEERLRGRGIEAISFPTPQGNLLGLLLDNGEHVTLSAHDLDNAANLRRVGAAMLFSRRISVERREAAMSVLRARSAHQAPDRAE